MELKDIIATRKEEVVTEKDLKSTNEEELDSTHEHKKKITPDCDWILDAFEERRSKRAAEMEGLTRPRNTSQVPSHPCSRWSALTLKQPQRMILKGFPRRQRSCHASERGFVLCEA